MNEDASPGVSADVQMGVKVPLIGSLGTILFTTGVIIGLVGGVILYFAVVRR